MTDASNREEPNPADRRTEAELTPREAAALLNSAAEGALGPGSAGSGERGTAPTLEALLPALQSELRAVAEGMFRRQHAAHTLQPTALVHEAYLKLVHHDDVRWEGRAHFLAVAAKAMRQILVDHHRSKKAEKRGGDWERQRLSAADLGLEGSSMIDLLELDTALEELAELDPRGSQVVELRFFGGLTMQEVAVRLGLSLRTIEGDWRHARAWLTRRLK